MPFAIAQPKDHFIPAQQHPSVKRILSSGGYRGLQYRLSNDFASGYDTVFRKSGKPVPSLPVDSAPSLAETFLTIIDRTQATIRFDPSGTILDANANFLRTLGYSLSEIVGRHHSIFVARADVDTDAYRDFWRSLAAGKTFTDQFPRRAKDGRTVWIQATYAPVFDTSGKTVSVLKIATDVTERQNGIETIATGLLRLSEGDLTHRVPASSLPDIAALGAAYNAALSQFSTTISAVKGVAATVADTAARVRQASNDLSQRTETQAATLEETAAALEQLTATVKAAAMGAQQVETSADSTKRTAQNGSKVVSDAIAAMAQIEKSSAKIAQIISVIDDIAFQTNLLALNAGVEAARANEAGRGFAVVASEVRALAQRAAKAAKEIKTLIDESSGHVKTGVGLVGLAGDELRKITAGVESIHSNITQISTGVREQAITLQEINTGVAQLDSVTQKNASMVEESTAASGGLANDARELAGQVSIFQTEPPGSERALFAQFATQRFA